jgi:hypothetical protein
MDGEFGVQGAEPGSGLLHERRANPVALEGMSDVEVVDEGASAGIASTVRAHEPRHARGIEGQLDELI